MRGSEARASSPAAALILSVRELDLYGEALLARDEVADPGHGAVRDEDQLAREGPDLGGAEPELLDYPGGLGRFDLYEGAHGVLALKDYGEPGDDVAQEALRAEAYDGGQDGGARRRGQRVADEDGEHEQGDYDEDHVPQGVTHQRDRRVLALDARDGLGVEHVLPSAPPQYPGDPVREHPVDDDPEHDHEHRRDHADYEVGADEVPVDVREELRYR